MPGDDAPRLRLGPYRLLEEIARGGMGAVYRGRHTDLSRDVAIKVLLGGRNADPRQRERFLREGRALSRIDEHPAIVRVHAADEAEGLPYLVLEFVEGPSLQRTLDEHGRLPPARAVAIARALADALATAHAAGVLHRDLKPSNVLLDLEGRPKLTDFGLAKDLERSLAEGLSAQGQLMGTPGYWPPEQARGELARIGPASDVYGVGALLYAMLTGQPPHGEPTSLVEALAVLDALPPPPSELAPGVSAMLDAVVLRCLQPEPGLRFAAMPELQQALDDVARGEGPAWRPPRVLLGAALLGAIAVGALAAAHHASGPAPASPPASHRPADPLEDLRRRVRSQALTDVGLARQTLRDATGFEPAHLAAEQAFCDVIGALSADPPAPVSQPTLEAVAPGARPALRAWAVSRARALLAKQDAAGVSTVLDAMSSLPPGSNPDEAALAQALWEQVFARLNDPTAPEAAHEAAVAQLERLRAADVRCASRALAARTGLALMTASRFGGLERQVLLRGVDALLSLDIPVPYYEDIHDVRGALRAPAGDYVRLALELRQVRIARAQALSAGEQDKLRGLDRALERLCGQVRAAVHTSWAQALGPRLRAEALVDISRGVEELAELEANAVEAFALDPASHAVLSRMAQLRGLQGDERGCAEFAAQARAAYYQEREGFPVSVDAEVLFVQLLARYGPAGQGRALADEVVEHFTPFARAQLFEHLQRWEREREAAGR